MFRVEGFRGSGLGFLGLRVFSGCSEALNGLDAVLLEVAFFGGLVESILPLGVHIELSIFCLLLTGALALRCLYQVVYSCLSVLALPRAMLSKSSFTEFTA